MVFIYMRFSTSGSSSCSVRVFATFRTRIIPSLLPSFFPTFSVFFLSSFVASMFSNPKTDCMMQAKIKGAEQRPSTETERQRAKSNQTNNQRAYGRSRNGKAKKELNRKADNQKNSCSMQSDKQRSQKNNSKAEDRRAKKQSSITRKPFERAKTSTLQPTSGFRTSTSEGLDFHQLVLVAVPEPMLSSFHSAWLLSAVFSVMHMC